MWRTHQRERQNFNVGNVGESSRPLTSETYVRVLVHLLPWLLYSRLIVADQSEDIRESRDGEEEGAKGECPLE